MGYEVGMQSTILALLRLFQERARDSVTNAVVTALVADRNKWPGAHGMFGLIREHLLSASGDAGRPPVPPDQVDWAKVRQYAFEELCLKAVYNETDTTCPFDACSPFWIAGSAIHLARALGIPLEAVIEIIAPEAEPAAGCPAVVSGP